MYQCLLYFVIFKVMLLHYDNAFLFVVGNILLNDYDQLNIIM